MTIPFFDKKERIAAFFDGSNFHNRLKELKLSHLENYDYKGLVNALAEQRPVVSCHYCVGAVRANMGDERGQVLRRNQQRLFAHLGKQGFAVEHGYLLKSAGVYHEKGVDVKIAVDLLVGAYEDLYDTALLISSDTDLIPAIHKVRQLKKKVQYVGFAHRPSLALKRDASSFRLLTKEDVDRFCYQEPTTL